MKWSDAPDLPPSCRKARQRIEALAEPKILSGARAARIADLLSERYDVHEQRAPAVRVAKFDRSRRRVVSPEALADRVTAYLGIDQDAPL